jgi:hypothetical protein
MPGDDISGGRPDTRAATTRVAALLMVLDQVEGSRKRKP